MPLVLQPDLSFESFVPTAGTRSALALARAMATHSEGSARLLVLHGPPGVGKTHLLRASVKRALKDHSSAVVAHLAGSEIIDCLVTAFRQGKDGPDPLCWKSAELVVLDDLHVLAGRPRTQHELARLMTEAIPSGCRFVCAAGTLLPHLQGLVAGLDGMPGVAWAALGHASEGELRRILTDIASRLGVQPAASDWRAYAASSGGDVRRALGALARHHFGQSLQLAR